MKTDGRRDKLSARSAAERAPANVRSRFGVIVFEASCTSRLDGDNADLISSFLIRFRENLLTKFTKPEVRLSHQRAEILKKREGRVKKKKQENYEVPS